MTLSQILLYSEREEGTPPVKTCKDITTSISAIPTEETYIIEIHIYDEDGNPLENAAITLNSYSDATDIYGGVIFEEVSGGDYTLTAELEGYEKYEETVTIDKDQSIDITLKKLKKIPPPKPSYIPIAVGVGAIIALGVLGYAVSKRKKVRK